MRTAWMLAPLGVLACAGAPLPREAAPSPRFAAQVEPLLARFIKEAAFPAVAVALVDAQGVEVYARGGPGAIDADTAFATGSTTKGLTGLLLADMVARGEVSLADTIGQLAAPTPVSAACAAISLEQLATHRSGLARLPPNLDWTKFTDPYLAYGAAELEAFLATCAPERPPAGSYEYSNLGAGLAGYLLAKRAGRPYADLLRERVLAPFGMKAAFVIASPADDARQPPGHDASGGQVGHWHWRALAAAGGVAASARDLATLLRTALFDPDGRRLFAAAAKPRAEYPGGQVGLFWHIQPSGVVWHNGRVAGFQSFVGLDPVRGIGVAVVANSGGERSFELAGELFKIVTAAGQNVPASRP